MRRIKLTPSTVEIKNFSAGSSDFQRLYGIYKDSIDPTLIFDSFQALYYSEKLLTIDFTLFYCDGKRAGFSAVFFYLSDVNGKPSFVARAATGLIKEFQGKGLHNKFNLYAKFIRFTLKHPRKPLWVAAFVINAFVFAELCKFVPQFFPRPGKQMPEDVENIVNEIIGGDDHERDPLHPHSVRVPIQVGFNKNLLTRIYDSNDPNVAWYLKENPGFLDKFGLFTIIPVTFKNIYGTIAAFTKHLINKKALQFNKNATNVSKSIRIKTVNLVEVVFKRWIL